jgi:Peptidase A4 family
MRRKWPVLTAAIPLAFGWALVAAHPAAAAVRDGVPGPGGQVQPGGPVSQLGQLSQPGGTFPGAPTGIVTPPASSESATGRSQDTSVSSSNWAGYAATGASGSFTSVSADWTQPTANCAAGSQYGAFWVGLDGYASKTVEQIGTEADCTGPSPQTPKYYAWYEVYPGAGVNFTNPVSPGDKFTGTVTSQGDGAFQLVLKDTTQNWTQTINATEAGADLSSAEAIVEAPSSTSGSSSSVLPLTNFGSVAFTGVTVNGKSMDTLNPVQITMPDTSVSDISSDGSFSVNYTGNGFAPWAGF